MAVIFVVGIGAGNEADITVRADLALRSAEVLVGYSTYIDLLKNRYPGKDVVSTAMTTEVERCEKSLEYAILGKNVVLVSSGDSGIYGMAGLMFEVYNAYLRNAELQEPVEIEVIPGVTALSLAAARLGAPLMHDFAVISLSDLMTPWEKIEKRIEYSAKGDFVLGLYNPKSIKRTEYIEIARDIILRERSGQTPVGIVRNAGREGETVVITTLDKMLENKIDMFSVVIIGNSQTYCENGRMITPRGYEI